MENGKEPQIAQMGADDGRAEGQADSDGKLKMENYE
jgi:hypothetical protein